MYNRLSVRLATVFPLQSSDLSRFVDTRDSWSGLFVLLSDSDILEEATCKWFRIILFLHVVGV